MKRRLFSLCFVLSVVIDLCAIMPLPEHPRPDWERNDWRNLNGEWCFALDNKGAGVREKWFILEDSKFDKKIPVPFSWGSPLSGIPDSADIGWYRRDITIPESWKGKRIFLVVGASDWYTTGWLDGKRLGAHSGGYVPFDLELTDHVKWGKTQKITLRVWDPSIRKLFKGAWKGPYHDGDWRLSGKQRYGNVRGIWQTVYLEARGADWLETVHFTPDIDKGVVKVEATLGEPARRPLEFAVKFKPEDRSESAKVNVRPGDTSVKMEIPLEKVRLWSLEDPYLYEVECSLGDDSVKTYFGMRKIGTGKMPGTGYPYVTLNNKPIYLQMALDQGYHPEGYYTFPSDDALKNEIKIAKELGLNGMRIHVKVEASRKLYWADKLGILIMADVPNSWGPACEEMFMEHWRCTEGMINRDYNHPSIFSWVLFNESWGLFEDAERNGRSRHQRYAPWVRREVVKAYRKTKQLDPTRLVEDNSNNSKDHIITDLNTWHQYTPFYNWEKVIGMWCRNTFPGSTNNYVGGFVQRGEPMLNSECGDVWGYKGGAFDCDLSWGYHAMINAFRRHPKCCGWMFTEHHDVKHEWNGYVREDRTAKEFGIEELTGGEMSLKDFHADAFIPLESEVGREFRAGETWTMPVDISLVTDKYAGKSLSLEYRLIYSDGRGCRRKTEYSHAAKFVAEAWQHGHIADVNVELPKETAAGVILFSLKDSTSGVAIARNFACFVTRGETIGIERSAPSKSKWAIREWNVLDGLKICGAGKGYFEYEFIIPLKKEMRKTSAVFRAEVSSKRLNPKDIPSKKTVEKKCTEEGLDLKRRMTSPNTYPMTAVAHKWPGEVKVYANGKLIKTLSLPDDPADHRGLLSWMSQKRDGTLHEAGSYGYLLEAKIPQEILSNSNEKLTIRLESTSDSGLAVYGKSFGRYPFDPYVEILE